MRSITFALLHLLLVPCSALQLSALQAPYTPVNRGREQLLSANFSIDDILLASGRPLSCTSTSNPGSIGNRLIYVTPWNKDGYSYTTLHSERISHVVPVWYQVKVAGSTVTLEGSHNVDDEWLSSLSSGTKVMPRFEIQFASRQELEAIIFFPRGEAERIVRDILSEVKRRDYAGVTLETQYVAQMTNLVTLLGTALHAMRKELVLVIPAHHQVDKPAPFSRSDALRVMESVDLFSLNAYDHATALGRESGNAPIPWLKFILDEFLLDADDEDDAFSDPDFSSNTERELDTTLASKILLGLNFYGYTFTSDGVMNTITGSEYRDLLEFSKVSIPLSIEWHEDAGEHRLKGQFWSIWYPTPLSLHSRINLAHEYGIGISVWEGGQGLPQFWDVLF